MKGLRTWRNWFGLRCWFRMCPGKLTRSHEPFGWRCVICRKVNEFYIEDWRTDDTSS